MDLLRASQASAIMGCGSKGFRHDDAGVLNPDLIPPGEYKLSWLSIARILMESSFIDLSSHDLCRSRQSICRSCSRERSWSSASESDEWDPTFRSPGPLNPFILFCRQGGSPTGPPKVVNLNAMPEKSGFSFFAVFCLNSKEKAELSFPLTSQSANKKASKSTEENEQEGKMKKSQFC